MSRNESTQQYNQNIQTYPGGRMYCIHAMQTQEYWKEEILNSFTWINAPHLSDGSCEGKNNYVKKILFNINGITNFQYPRNKFIYSQNLYEGYTVSEHTKEIRKVGNPRRNYKKQRSMMTARIHCPYTFKLKVG